MILDYARVTKLELVYELIILHGSVIYNVICLLIVQKLNTHNNANPIKLTIV